MYITGPQPMSAQQYPPPGHYYNPAIWGPHFWFFIHTVALTYPKYPNAETKKHYYLFFRNLYMMMPVDDVSREYRQLLQDYPLVPYLDDRAALVKWVHFIHNRINARLEKPQIPLDEFYRRYYDQYTATPEKMRRQAVWQLRWLRGGVLAAVVGATVWAGWSVLGPMLRPKSIST